MQALWEPHCAFGTEEFTKRLLRIHQQRGLVITASWRIVMDECGIEVVARHAMDESKALEYPAVRAWRRLKSHETKPTCVRTLSRYRKAVVYRLGGVGLGGSSILAKWRRKSIAAKRGASARHRTFATFCKCVVIPTILFVLLAIVCNARSLYSVSGVVLDQTQAAIAGAKVTLQPKNRGNTRSTVTGPEGGFSLEGLDAESYKIKVQQDTFKPYTSTLKAGQRSLSSLRIVLTLDTVYQEVTVSAETPLSSDTTENLDVTSLDRHFLESLPILGNDVVSAALATIDPVSLGAGGGTILVDGVPTRDVGLPASAIQEIKINQNPYSAEYSAPGQSRIQITTNSASAHFHGSLYTEFRDYLLDARNAFAVDRPPERRLAWDGSLSGPMGKSKKTSFTLSVSRERDQLQSVVYALTPNGALHQNFPSPQRTDYMTASVSREVSANKSLVLRYMFFDWSDNGQGVGGLGLPETATNHSSARHYLYITDKDTISTRLVNEFSTRMVTSNSITRSVLASKPSIIVLGAFTGGGGGNNQRQTQNYAQLTDTLYWSQGNHVTKAGLNIPDFSRRGLDDRGNFNGTYQFSSLADYLAARPFSFTQQLGNPRLIYWETEFGLFVQHDWRVNHNLSMGLGLRYDWQSYVPNHNNFAPRISIAFAPGKSPKTVLRAGAGIFYQPVPVDAIADMLRFGAGGLQQILLTNPGYPDPFAFGALPHALPSNLVRFEPGLRLPYTAQYSFGVERKIFQSTSVTATYVGNRGLHLFRSRDINAPLSPLFEERPDPLIGTLRQIESSGRLRSNSLKLGVRTNWSRFLEGMAQYTLAHSHDDTAGIKSFPANQYSLAGEWSRSDFDVRHTLSLSGTLQASKLFDVGVVLSMRSGRPYTMTTGTDDYNDGLANARPLDVPRNSLQGAGAATLDLRWNKAFALPFAKGGSKKDRPRASLSLDAFNVLNRVNFQQFVGDLSSPFFRQPIGAGPARRIQATFKVKF